MCRVIRNDFFEFGYGKGMGKNPKIRNGKGMEKSFPTFWEWESESFPGISKIRNENGKKKQKNKVILKILGVRRSFGPKYPQYPKTDSLTFWLNLPPQSK